MAHRLHGFRHMAIHDAPTRAAFTVRRLARLASGLLLATTIAGCSGTTPSLGRMLGTAPPPPTATPAPAKAAKAKSTRRVYYANAEGTKVYAQPSGTSSVVGSLSLSEKVLRSRVERGYALIESSKTGVKGWVDNARLTWKAPGAQPSAGAAATAAPVEEPEGAPEEEEETAPEPPAEPTPTTAPVAPPKTPTPSGVGPSIFNPY